MTVTLLMVSPAVMLHHIFENYQTMSFKLKLNSEKNIYLKHYIAISIRKLQSHVSPKLIFSRLLVR